MTKPIINTAQAIAVGEYLSDWPERMTYDELMTCMRAGWTGMGECDIDPCEYFEDWYPPASAERIDQLRVTLEQNYDEPNLELV